MLKNKGERATANLRMLEFVARKLGPLNDEVVYLGGCSTALFITDSLLLYPSYFKMRELCRV